MPTRRDSAMGFADLAPSRTSNNLTGLAASIHAPRNLHRCRPSQPMDPPVHRSPALQDLDNLSPEQTRLRRREWNRGPITDLFPKIPDLALDRILDICIDVKDFTYNLSESKRWNQRRLTSIVVAHVRHAYSDYDKLLREDQLERYEARKRSGPQVWNVLRKWSPWDDSNPVLEQAFNATLLPPELRDPTWDPMDVDDESDLERDPSSTLAGPTQFDDDAMDLD